MPAARASNEFNITTPNYVTSEMLKFFLKKIDDVFLKQKVLKRVKKADVHFKKQSIKRFQMRSMLKS